MQRKFLRPKQEQQQNTSYQLCNNIKQNLTLEIFKQYGPWDQGEVTIMEIILWDFLMFYQIFLSPQVKRSGIISNKQDLYKLPHKLLNDLRLRILENKEKSGESPNLLEL